MPMLTPYLLAGGLSTRMGQDKAFLRLQGQTLLEHALRRLAPLGTPRILGGDPANGERQARLATFAPVVPDRTPNAGPLGGIDAALHETPAQHTPRDWVLILPIDQPNLPTAALQTLIAVAVAAHATAAWFTQPTGPEPLPVLLHPSFAGPVAHALAQGDRKLVPTLRRIAGTRLVEVPCPNPGWFLNLNSPIDIPAPVEITRAEILSIPHQP